MEDLDRWIAENINKFPVIDDHEPLRNVLKYGGYIFDDDPYIFTGLGYQTKPWHPSTDIAQAMQVVGKMREKGWRFEMHIQEEDQWACFSKCPLPFHPKIFCSDDKEIATAICLAAKKALEE